MAAKQLHVLFLPKWYPSKFDEFDGNFIEDHAKAIAKKCTIGLIFVHSDDSITDAYRLEKTTPHGFPEWRVFYKKADFSLGIVNKAIGFYRYYKAQQFAYKSYVEEMGTPDLSHVHINGRSALLALQLKKKFKIPFLISEHWSGYTKENGAFSGNLRKWAYRYIAQQSKAITCVSNYLKEAMQSHHIKSNYHLIPNVVNTALFQAAPKEERTRKRIVHISNLSRTPKNIHLIVEALHQVGLKREDFTVDIIGTGADEKEMLSQLEKSSINDRFQFHGEIALPEVAQILAQSDFMLLYSQYETQSVVLIESFACGIPVLAPNVGGVPEYMSRERGILLPPNSVEILTKGIDEMLDKTETFDSSKMVEYARNEFSEEKISSQFKHLYSQILSHV
ncbi:MAG: glycosyltransferase family 4 protein [Flavobacteriales bacterium]|nr:glycosyltransferase family 4 protein [Flavobacteriales bacterium]